MLAIHLDACVLIKRGAFCAVCSIVWVGDKGGEEF